MDQISVRMFVLLLVGGLTLYVALRHPALGVAVVVAAVVVTLLRDLLGK